MLLRKRLNEKIREKATIYAVSAQFIFMIMNAIKVGAATTSNFLIFETSTKVFAEYKNFENVFFSKKENVLISHKDCDYVIEIDKEMFYEPLYNFLTSELQILREYIDDLLTKK